jgi:hypothetical protein
MSKPTIVNFFLMNNSDLIEKKKGLNPHTRKVYNMDSTLLGLAIRVAVSTRRVCVSTRLVNLIKNV